MDYYAVIEKARKTGKIDKGTNEVTKAIERGVAKVVFFASDTNPKEIVSHISSIAKEKGILCFEVDSKQKLGIAAGIPVSASAVAIIELGDTDKDLKALKMEDEASQKGKEKIDAQKVEAEADSKQSSETNNNVNTEETKD